MRHFRPASKSSPVNVAVTVNFGSSYTLASLCENGKAMAEEKSSPAAISSV